MTILLLADHDGKTLGDGTARALSAARSIGGDVHILVAAANARPIAEAAARLDGVAKVLVAESPDLEHQLAEPVASLLLRLMRDGGHDVLMAAATSVSRDILPRVAGCLGVMQVSDITGVVAPDTFERPIYAGTAIETVKTTDNIKVITVRASAFADTAVTDTAAAITDIAPPEGTWRARFEKDVITQSDRPDLSSARVVVSGGRGLGSADNFRSILEPLAQQLGAAVGASRAAVDADFAPNDLQVGQTGKIVAPELYVAVGISGAIQHLAGMKDSKIIVAVNKDEEAPIFQVADFGLVGDLFTVVPELVRGLS